MTEVASRPPAVEMRGIHKRFGPVLANADVSLRVLQGTVHGIVGENGAGKSTLMSILYGFYQADGGSIELEGKAARITGSREAIALGIGMVHQHFMLVESLPALDNVMLGAEPGWLLQPARALNKRQWGSAPSITLSSAHSVSTSMKCWCTMPMPSAMASCELRMLAGWPSTLMEPLSLL